MKKTFFSLIGILAWGTFASQAAFGATEALESLQSEVIQAKQNHKAISSKIENVDLFLDQEKSKFLETEANQLIDELVTKNYSQSQQAASAALEGGALPSSSVSETSAPVVLKPTPSEKKYSFKRPRRPKELWWLGWKDKPYAQEGSISDAEALYKVAISDNKITIEEAVDIGLENSLDIKALEKKVEVAAAKLTEANRALFPTVQGVINNNRGLVSGRYYKGRSYKVNVTQPLFYGGELVLTVKQAQANLESAKQEYEKARGEYILKAKTAYYGVVKAEYNTEYQNELYEKIRLIYQRSRREHDENLVPEVDFLNIEFQFHQAFFQTESAKNDLDSARLILSQTLSLDSRQSLPVDLKLRFKKVDPVFDQVLQAAIDNNPEIKIKQMALDSAEYGVKIYAAKKLPRFDLRGSYGMLGEVFKDTTAIATDNHDLDLEKEWFLGITGSMPIGPNSVEVEQIKHVYGPTVLALTGSQDRSTKVSFNLLDRFADITDEKSAQATYLQAESDFKKAKDDLTVQIKDDFYNLQKSLIQIDSSISKVRYQEKQNSILEYMVSLQEGSLKDFLEGLIELAQDKFSFIQAVTEYDLALSSLGVAIGDPDYFETQPQSSKS
jgi:outer membrane protein TolC